MAQAYNPTGGVIVDSKTGFATRVMTLWIQAIQSLLLNSDPAGCFIQWGTGSPEGSVIGPIGSLYMRKDGGVLTTLYVKTSGTGNVGWTAK